MDSPTGNLLREAREKAGLSKYAVQERCGVRHGNLWKYEMGRRLPSVAAFQSLCGLYGLDFEQSLRILQAEQAALQLNRHASRLAGGAS